MRMSTSLISILIILILLPGCSSQTSQPLPEKNNPKSNGDINTASGKTVTVEIKGFKFVPPDVNIKVGDAVVWTNKDSAPHTVESSDGILRSDELSNGDTFSFTFPKPGKYDYICGIHTSMKGSVTVN